MRHPGMRWLAPAAVAVVVAGSVSLAHAAAAEPTAAGSLPAITAQQLLARVGEAASTPVSGTVTATADLGLPQLPSLGSGGGSDTTGLTSLISGSHTLRVWYDGPSRQRVATLSTMGETDVIHDGQQVWTWNSSDGSVTRQDLPTQAATEAPAAGDAMASPAAAAASALKLIGPSTSVTVSSDQAVAGRAAYQLTLTPKGTGSLVAAVRIAVDGATFVPLRVEVDSAATRAAALTIGFTSVSFAPVSAAEFTFTPPPGSTVTTHDAAALGGMFSGLTGDAAPSVVGSGWTSVVVAHPDAGHSPTAAASPTIPGSLGMLLRNLPTVSGSWGTGHLLAGTLVTVVITDSGTIAAGAATPEVVLAALAHS